MKYICPDYKKCVPSGGCTHVIPHNKITNDKDGDQYNCDYVSSTCPKCVKFTGKIKEKYLLDKV